MKINFPVFWMASSFIRSLENLSTRWFISNYKVEKLVEIFLEEYFSLTRFSNYTHLFPAVRIFELLTFLSEHNVGNKKVHNADIHLVEKLNDFLAENK